MTLVRMAAVLAYGYAVTATVLSRVPPGHIPDQSRQWRSPTVELALEVLAESDRLYAAQVGFAGVNPPQLLAWRVILLNPHADSLLFELINRSARPGQLYALAGLRWLRDYGRLDPNRYNAALQRLKSGPDDEMVLTQIGCIGGSQSIRSLLVEVDSGLWGRKLLTGRLQGGR